MTRAEAERLLGPEVVEAVRREVKEAPPLSTEQRERIRAVFAADRAINGLAPAAKAA